jgi:hypothetical protein
MNDTYTITIPKKVVANTLIIVGGILFGKAVAELLK